MQLLPFPPSWPRLLIRWSLLFRQLCCQRPGVVDGSFGVPFSLFEVFVKAFHVHAKGAIYGSLGVYTLF
jgi:hypothetical protein